MLPVLNLFHLSYTPINLFSFQPRLVVGTQLQDTTRWICVTDAEGDCVVFGEHHVYCHLVRKMEGCLNDRLVVRYD